MPLGQARRITWGPFGSIMSGLAEPNVPNPYATGGFNFQTDSTGLSPRFGFTKRSAPQTGFQAASLAAYVAGNNDGDLAEQVVTMETVSGTTRPYIVELSTGNRTVITDGGTPLSLTAGVWECATYEGRALMHRRGAGPIFAHTVGEADSWDELDVSNPASGYSPPQVSFEITEDILGNDPQPPFNWAGADADTVDDQGGNGGPVAFSAEAAGVLTLAGTTSENNYPVAHFRLNLGEITAGDPTLPDLSLAKRIEFDLVMPVNDVNGSDFITNLSEIEITLTNDDGTPVSLQLIVSDTVVNDPATGGFPKTHKLKCSPPSSWGTTFGSAFSEARFLEVKFTYDPVGPGNGGEPWLFHIGEVTPVNTAPAAITITDDLRIQFAHAPYDSVIDAEATHLRETEWFNFQGPNRYALSGDTDLIGNIPTLMADAPPDADAIRYFVRFSDDTAWRLIGERPKSDPSLTVDKTEQALRNLELRTAPKAEPLGTPAFMFTHAGSAFWLYNKGTSNIKISYQGVAERLAKSTDDLDDASRGRTLSLADDASDAPVWGASAGSAAIILGKRGAYSMFGLAPTLMTPVKKLANDIGLYGRCAARWRTDENLTAVIYMGVDFNLWLAYAREGMDNDTGGYVQEVSTYNRGLVAKWLGITRSTDPETTRMATDPVADAIWIVKGYRAVVLRKAHLLDGNRPFECYEYNVASGWSHVVAVPGFGLWGVRASGAIDQFDRDPDTGEPIDGTNIDDGAQMPEGEYPFPRIQGERSRIARVETARDTAIPVDVTITSAEQGATTYTIAAERRSAKVGKHQVGEYHDVVLAVPEGMGRIDRMTLEIWPMPPKEDKHS